LSIVRLSREANLTSASVLSAEGILEIWADPVLRYSHVLDGLFHSRVIVAENERDCTFYGAAIDSENERECLPVPPNEVLLVASHGKDGIPPIVKALATIKVPIVATPDIDMLNDWSKLKKLVEALGGDCSTLEEDYRACTNYLRAPRKRLPLDLVASTVENFFKEVKERDGRTDWTNDHMEELRVLLRTNDNPWNEIKKYGVRGFQGDVRGRVNKLLDQLDDLGVVIVRVGELESFANDYPVSARKGAGWLREALLERVHEGADAANHVKRLMRTTSAQTPSL
jgi:hypothetical protein